MEHGCLTLETVPDLSVWIDRPVPNLSLVCLEQILNPLLEVHTECDDNVRKNLFEHFGIQSLHDSFRMHKPHIPVI